MVFLPCVMHKPVIGPIDASENVSPSKKLLMIRYHFDEYKKLAVAIALSKILVPLLYLFIFTCSIQDGN